MSPPFFWFDYSQKDKWREWISKLPHEKRDIYYDPDYLKLYADGNTEANCYVYAQNGNVYLYPFMKSPVPRLEGYFDICSPYGYGGPLANTRDPVFLETAYRRFHEEALKRNIIAELIKFHPLLNNSLFLKEFFLGNIARMRSTVYVEIGVDEKERWEKIYTHANRKNINKAKRNNMEVRIGQDDELWEGFERLYTITMRSNDAGKFYYFSSEYFNHIRSDCADHYVLVGCLHQKEVISVLLVLLGTVYAHCHLIGTTREQMALGGNNLLHHELILWCKKNGYEKLHIGGGRTDGDEDSLFRFKQNFSDKKSDFYVGESILNPGVYNELCAKWQLENAGKDPPNRLFKYRG